MISLRIELEATDIRLEDIAVSSAKARCREFFQTVFVRAIVQRKLRGAMTSSARIKSKHATFVQSTTAFARNPKQRIRDPRVKYGTSVRRK